LGARGNSGYFLTEQGVDEGGLANIWASDNGNKAGAKVIIHKFFNLWLGKYHFLFVVRYG
jgi:hypothetical protein